MAEVRPSASTVVTRPLNAASFASASRHRRSMTASVHYGEDNRQIQRTVHADFTRTGTPRVAATDATRAVALARR
jgi:hypothetical protein